MATAMAAIVMMFARVLLRVRMTAWMMLRHLRVTAVLVVSMMLGVGVGVRIRVRTIVNDWWVAASSAPVVGRVASVSAPVVVAADAVAVSSDSVRVWVCVSV